MSLCIAFLCAAVTHSAFAQAPQRILSMNVCTDEMLVRLVPRERIAAVSWLARDSAISNVAREAASVPVNYGNAEEAIPLAPDLVLGGQFTARAAQARLRQTGFRVETFGLAQEFAGALEQIEHFGALVGSPASARTLRDDMQRGWDATAAPADAKRLRALVLTPNGVTVGAKTLADAVMTHVGLDNLAASLDLGGYHQVPLERVAALDIDMLIVSGLNDTAPSLATDVLRHPVLIALRDRIRIVEMPGRLWGCAGPGLIEAAQKLSAVAADLRTHQRPLAMR